MEDASYSVQNWPSSNLSRKSAIQKVRTLNICFAVNAVRLGNIDNQFSFETGCFIYLSNMLKAESFKLRTVFRAY